MEPVFEVNFDGLVGPTHNYAGLSSGNLASMSHRGRISNPRAAALQGLAKMKLLADLGLRQAVLPPHGRPSVETLRALGFSGSDAAVLSAAARTAPDLLAACCSSSPMWVANAATVTPASDTGDGRVHVTPANLCSKFHRSIEPPQTASILRAIFRDGTRFAVHDPLPGGPAFADEGAANHTRLAPAHAHPGLHFFVHGRHALGGAGPGLLPKKFAPRQTFEASQAVARCHLLSDMLVCHARQSPAAIDAGVFHNDVISVGNENLFFYHEKAFVRTGPVVADLRRQFARLYSGAEFFAIKVPARRVSLAVAVKSYLFNSQIVTLRPGHMALVAPSDCREIPAVRKFIEEMLEAAATPLREVRYVDLKQSMRNGGGPACLRLRVVLSARELAAIPEGVMINNVTYPLLVAWVKQHYRERLTPADLADPRLLTETRHALDELTRILGLGSIYPFQQE